MLGKVRLQSRLSRTWQRFSYLLMALMAIAAMLTATSPAAGASSAPSATTTFTVSSTVGWQKTPITLTAGDTYGMAYESGTWTVDYRNFPQVGPQGYSSSVDKTIYQGCKYNPTSNYGVLLGVVGDSAEDFVIGAGGVFTANNSGPLYLRINDDDACLGDNAGSVTMYIDRFQHISNGSSSIYAGYSLHPAKGYVSYALAQWKVPSVSCNLPFEFPAQLAVWVGLWGGPNNTTGTYGSKTWLVQTGIVAQCREFNGIKYASKYEAVYQLYNAKSASGFKPLFNVKPGDAIYAQVEYKGTTSAGAQKFWFDLTDETSGAQQQQYKYLHPSVSASDAAYQGGIIVERVTSGGVTGDFPQFSSINFSGVNVGQDSSTTNEWTGYRWDMTGYAKTGPLTTSPNPGGNFNVVWQHA